MPSSNKPDKGNERISGPALERVSGPAEAAEHKAAEDKRIEELLHPSPTEAEA